MASLSTAQVPAAPYLGLDPPRSHRVHNLVKCTDTTTFATHWTAALGKAIDYYQQVPIELLEFDIRAQHHRVKALGLPKPEPYILPQA